jgi:hypothetical protein
MTTSDNLPFALRQAREQAAAVAEALIAANRVAEIPAAIRLGLPANQLPSVISASTKPRSQKTDTPAAGAGFDRELSRQRLDAQMGRTSPA